MMERFLIRKGWYEKIPKIVRWLYTMMVVNIGWIAFRVTDFKMFKAYARHLIGKDLNLERLTFDGSYFLSFRVLLLVAVCVAGMIILRNTRVQDRLQQWDKEVVGFAIVKYLLLAMLFFLSVCAVIASKYQPFLYFQF